METIFKSQRLVDYNIRWCWPRRSLIFKWWISDWPLGFPSGSDGKESACNAGDLGSIPELGRSPGEGNGNPLQYSCLENAMDRGAWQTTVHRVGRKELDMTERLTHTLVLAGLVCISNGKGTQALWVINWIPVHWLSIKHSPTCRKELSVPGAGKSSGRIKGRL